MNERQIHKFGYTVMAFGKYEGEFICDVPLSYLDKTISVMPPTWFVRSVHEFVSWVMAYLLDEHNPNGGVQPNSSSIMGLDATSLLCVYGDGINFNDRFRANGRYVDPTTGMRKEGPRRSSRSSRSVDLNIDGQDE